MAWSTIRKATTEDEERLDKAAGKFMKRHKIEYMYSDDGNKESAILAFLWDQQRTEVFMTYRYATYLLRLWKGCVHRALRDRDADGIAYGYVGCHVD